MEKNQSKDIADFIRGFGAETVIDSFKEKPKPDWNKIMKIAQESKSDRVMSFAWGLLAQQKVGRIQRPSFHNWGRAVDIISCPKLLEELLNYKPKEMKRFKGNKLAVTGDIIELLKFEKELKKLGYENTGGKGDVFHYRGDRHITSLVYARDENKIAKFITIGLHYCASKSGQYTPAMNNGNADLLNAIFTLPQDFDKALKLASELRPLFVTEDKVEIFDTKTKVYGLKKIGSELKYYSKDQIYRNYAIVTTNFSIQLLSSYKWFSSFEAAKQFIDNTVPLLTTEDGVAKFVNDQAYCVKPDFTYYWVKKGLDEKTPWPGFKYFNTDAAAQNYIDENKPQFSKKQIKDTVNNSVSKMDITIPGLHRVLTIHHIDGEKLKKGFNL